MQAISLHDKEQIYQCLKEDMVLHLYSIGDLDDFFWPRTQWFGLLDGDRLRQVCLLYMGHDMPILLALARDIQPMATLLEEIKPYLPPRFYAHFSPRLEDKFSPGHQLEDHGLHYKMALRDRSRLPDETHPSVTRISEFQLQAVRAFYQRSYPENWFDPRMLETHQYFGVQKEGSFLSVGGVHVFSPRYDVAALGNIATHPEHRNQGLASMVTAQLCRSLSQEVDHIGLNVKADNLAAIHCYRKLGFEKVACYHEFTIHKT